LPLCHCPQGVLEHVTINNFPIGRNVDEALRTLQVNHDVAGRLAVVLWRCVQCVAVCSAARRA
jgi:alkyl hydroperoxide reductase subunit AhpC